MSVLAILFDLDGTLIDSLGDISGVVNLVRKEWKLAPWPAESVRPCVGRGKEHLIRHVMPEIPDDEVLQAVERYTALFLKLDPPSGQLYPGVRETMAYLRSLPSLKLAIATNKTAVVAEKALRHYLPDIQFDAVAGPENVSKNKPNPEHLLEVLEQIGVPPSGACYVGDDPVDAQCAQASGVRFLGATYGIGRVQVPPEAQLSNFTDLPVILGLRR